MRRRLVLCCFGLMALLAAPSLPAQDRSMRIVDFDATYELGADGVLDVTEKITVEFRGEWNGLRRELSRRHNTAQGRSTRLDIDVGEITDGNGTPLTVERDSENGMLI